VKHINSSDNFKKDLQRGRDIENLILNKVKQKYACAVLIDGKFKDYDLFIPETNKTIEIKGDYRSCQTGNILIELMMFNVPSAYLSNYLGRRLGYLGTRARVILIGTTPI
jgi:hypothetical protein